MPPPPTPNDPIPGIFPAGRISILGGSPHAGKSTLMAQLAGALMSGGEWLGMRANETPVTIVFTDRSMRDNDHWLSLLPKRPPAFSLVNDPNFRKLRTSLDERSHLPGLKEFYFVLERVKPERGSVLLVDVFSNSFTGDMLSPQSVRSHMTIMCGVCEEQGITLIGTVYGMKITVGMNTRYERYVDRIIGAATFRGSVSTSSYLATREETGLGDMRQRLEIAPRGETNKLLTLDREKNGFFFVSAVDEIIDTVEKVSEKTQAILDYMIKEYPQPFTGPDLLKWAAKQDLSISPVYMRVMLTKLVALGAIQRVQRGLYKAKPTPMS